MHRDVVINCAGALQDGLLDRLEATQAKAMIALYKTATAQEKPPLIVQPITGYFLATQRGLDYTVAWAVRADGPVLAAGGVDTIAIAQCGTRGGPHQQSASCILRPALSHLVLMRLSRLLFCLGNFLADVEQTAD